VFKYNIFSLKDFFYLPYVGLPNILAQEFIVPELLQEAATPAGLSNSYLELGIFP